MLPSRKSLHRQAVIVIVLGFLGCQKTDQRQGNFDPPLDAEASIREGNQLVPAIFAYRRETGLWPISLDDCHSLHSDLKARWVYAWKPGEEGGWSLKPKGRMADETVALVFNFRLQEAAWYVFTGNVCRQGAGGHTFLPGQEPDPKVTLALVHRLAEQTGTVDAALTCVFARAELGDPLLAIQMLDDPVAPTSFREPEIQARKWEWYAKAYGAEAGAKKAVEWAERQNSLKAYSCAACVCYRLERTTELVAAVAGCSRCPLSTDTYHAKRESFDLWNNSHLLYKREEFGALLQLCDVWEQTWQKGETAVDVGFTTWQAAALIRLGRFSEADTALRKHDTIRDKYTLHPLETRMTPLHDAIRAKAAQTIYTPVRKLDTLDWYYR